MDHHTHEIKTYLETLTTGELVKMADTQGIDIPPDLERIFIIQEIIEAEADFEFDESETGAEVPADHDSILEQVSLPHQYNVNYLEVLLRDSLWAFVYWEINSLDREAYESSSDFKGFFLHVIPLSSKGVASTSDSFTISVGNTDDSWRIYLSPDIRLFQVNLCVNRRGHNEVIISSRQLYVPQILDPADEAIRNSPHYPFLRLSGIEEFEILRNVDKVVRKHRLFGE
ncbi:MAG: DUF4912 domain-containing protein [Treponema sp.]|nr:DUF4912 domain-containing protein [Treponema sp.]